ncbi:hypothetical protein ANN_04192 [Periplaneta americana]|uniref:Uncharacterized protein n=1 Tax=Periplaneta americana TaxID=6978 RepID=A0ABQ8T7W4_PERAM|nr:hypothetical protein ANN_04192 [Periplaneta americana]
MGESRNAYRMLVGRPEGKRPLGRPRRRWEDDIKMDLRDVGYDDREWINLAQDRDRWRAYVRAAMNLRVILRRCINILGYLASECDEGDNAGEMSPGSSTESYSAFAQIGLRENPGKKPQPGNLPRPGFEPVPPGFAARRANRYSTGVPLHASKSTDMNLSHLSTLKCHRPGSGSNPQPQAQKAKVIPIALTQADLRSEVSKKRIVIRALDAARRTQCAVRLEEGERLVPQQMGAVSGELRQRSAYVYK